MNASNEKDLNIELVNSLTTSFMCFSYALIVRTNQSVMKKQTLLSFL